MRGSLPHGVVDDGGRINFPHDIKNPSNLKMIGRVLVIPLSIYPSSIIDAAVRETSSHCAETSSVAAEILRM